MDKKAERNWWLKVAMVALAVGAIGFFLSTDLVQDGVQNLLFQESAEVAKVRESLQLTNKGKWIFGATQPQLETREDFNVHCESQNFELALLGCYADGKIYVYQISDSTLADANKVTMAHELLHAVWDRMGREKQRQVKELLDEVWAENTAWFEAELAAYDEDMKLEEVWARAGTKLEKLPEELERIYAEYFQDRKVIVVAYQNYEKPFLELQAKSDKLLAEVTQGVAEIEKEKEEYLVESQRLSEEIESFNQCAEQEGCFVDDTEFERRRSELLEKSDKLDKRRDEINVKVDENNAKVQQIEEYQMALGEMNDKLNSHATEKVK